MENEKNTRLYERLSDAERAEVVRLAKKILALSMPDRHIMLRTYTKSEKGGCTTQLFLIMGAEIGPLEMFQAGLESVYALCLSEQPIEGTTGIILECKDYQPKTDPMEHLTIKHQTFFGLQILEDGTWTDLERDELQKLIKELHDSLPNDDSRNIEVTENARYGEL